MKKRFLSLLIVLSFVMALVPMSVSAGNTAAKAAAPIYDLGVGSFRVPTTNDTSAYSFEKIDNGFKLVANPVNATGNTKGAKIYYKHAFYEGKISFEINTDAITAYTMNGTTKSYNKPGVIFGSSSYYGSGRYEAYFEGDAFNIYGYGANWANDKADVQSVGNYQRQVVDITKKVPGWLNGDTVKLSLAFSQAGAVAVWVNDVEILKIDVTDKSSKGFDKKCVPYGTNLGIFNGAMDLPLEITNFKIEGKLDFRAFGGEGTYDSNNHTFTATAANTFGYITNRTVRNGKIIVISKDAKANGNGPIFGVTHTDLNNKWEGNGLSYYIVDLNANRFCAWAGHDNGHVSKMTTTSGTALQSNNGRWIFGSNTSGAIKTVDFNLNTSTATIALNANNTVNVTDSAPFSGGYYGVRLGAADSSVAYYVVNNELEAMSISVDKTTLDAASGTYTATLKTFPAGSKINSGDKIAVSGNGVQQVGDAVDKGNGTYTVSYTVDTDSATTANISVDNHIFGTLEASIEIAAKDNGNTDSGNTDSGNTDSGNTDSGNTDSGNTDSGNTDGGNTDSGNTDSGNTDSGNTDSGNTDSGNTDSGNTDNGNTDSGNTDNGNTDNGNTDSDEPKDPNAGADNGDANNEASTENGAGDETKKLPTLLIAIAAAFAALVIVAIIVIIVKKKKK